MLLEITKTVCDMPSWKFDMPSWKFVSLPDFEGPGSCHQEQKVFMKICLSNILILIIWGYMVCISTWSCIYTKYYFLACVSALNVPVKSYSDIIETIWV